MVYRYKYRQVKAHEVEDEEWSKAFLDFVLLPVLRNSDELPEIVNVFLSNTAVGV